MQIIQLYWCNCFVKLVHTLANCCDRELVQNNPASTRSNKKESSREWTRSVISPSYWKSGQSRGFQRLENSRASRVDAILALARTPSCLWTSVMPVDLGGEDTEGAHQASASWMRPDLITSTDRARARGAKKIKPPQPGVRIPRQLRIRWYLYLYTCGKVTPEKCTVGIQCSLDAAEESNFVEQSSECPNTTQLRSRSSRKRFRKLEECKDINAQKVRWSTSRIMQRYTCDMHAVPSWTGNGLWWASSTTCCVQSVYSQHAAISLN